MLTSRTRLPHFHLSASRWRQVLEIEDGAITGMSGVLLVHHHMGMGVDSL